MSETVTEYLPCPNPDCEHGYVFPDFGPGHLGVAQLGQRCPDCKGEGEIEITLCAGCEKSEDDCVCDAMEVAA